MVSLASFILFLGIPTVCPYNFLVLSPTFAHSHSTYMGSIADTLKDAGHNVTFLTIVVASKFRNVSYTKSVTDKVFIETTQEIDSLMSGMESGDFSRFWVEDGSMLDTIPTFRFFLEVFEKVMDNLRLNTKVLDALRDTRPKYDVMIFEGMMIMGNLITDYLKIPVYIPVTSVTHDTRVAGGIGEPISPSYLSGYLTNYGNVMSFPERVINTISFFLDKQILVWPTYYTIQDPTKVLEAESTFHRAPFTFTNSNPYIDFPRPMLTKTVQIGGITVDVKALKSHTVDEKWNEILNRRPHNVLISFGSMFHSVYMPESYKMNFISVMKSLSNVTFIWKYESDALDFAKGADNIVFSKWVPQTALLADSRLSAFLTHGGLGSVNELSYLGTPAILCPLFADQLRNSKMLARHNGSIEISKHDLPNFSALRSAFQRILFEKNYYQNAKNLAKRLENQPIKPKELLIRHAEFAAEFGELPSLDFTSTNLSFIQYFLLDVIAFFIFLLLLATLLSYYSVYFLLKSVFNRGRVLIMKKKLE